MSIRDKVQAADDIESEVIFVSQWDVKIEVRSMTARARAMMLKQAAQEDGTLDFEGLYPAILIATSFDPDNGEKVFTDADAQWLNGKAAGPIEKLAQAGMRLSGITSDSHEDEKKDSSNTPTSDTPSS